MSSSSVAMAVAVLACCDKAEPAAASRVQPVEVRDTATLCAAEENG